MPFEGEKFEEILTPSEKEEEEKLEEKDEIEERLTEREKIIEDVFKESWEIELEKGIEKLNSNLKEFVSIEREEVALEKYGHIDFIAFEGKRGKHFGYYSPEMIKKDKLFVEEREREWKEEKERQKKKGEREYREYLEKERDGELFERYVTVIFHKFLGKDFFVARSSRYDDYKNHVDTLLIDRETGVPFCAFDEVCETSGPRFEKKKEEIFRKNKEGGAHIKYGYRFEKGKLVPDSLSNVPIFYLALDKWTLKDCIKTISPSLSEKSPSEKLAFDTLKSEIMRQIEELESRLPPISPIRKKIEFIEKKLFKF
jgi:hypothetical protein